MPRSASAFAAIVAAALACSACETMGDANDMESADAGAQTEAGAAGGSSAGATGSGVSGSGMAGSGAMAAAGPRDVVATARATGQFTGLLSAARAAGLLEILQGPGPYTIFAPTDEAFRALPPELLTRLQDPANVGQLRAVLSYHIVPGRVTASQLAAGTEQATALGRNFTLSIAGAPGAVTVEGARVLQPDVTASNGVIHVIDRVLIPTPPSTPATP